MTPDEHIEDPQTEIGQMSDHLREYIGIRRELFELKMWDKLVSTASSAITWAIIAIVGVICVFFLSAAAAYAIGVALGKIWLGFLIVAGAYGLVAIIIILGRNKLLHKPLSNLFIDNLINDDDDEEDESDRQDQQQKAA